MLKIIMSRMRVAMRCLLQMRLFVTDLLKSVSFGNTRKQMYETSLKHLPACIND